MTKTPPDPQPVSREAVRTSLILLRDGWTPPLMKRLLGQADRRVRRDKAWLHERVVLAEVASAEVAAHTRHDSHTHRLHHRFRDARSQAEGTHPTAWGRWVKVGPDDWRLVCSEELSVGDPVAVLMASEHHELHRVVAVLCAQDGLSVVHTDHVGDLPAEVLAGLPLAALAPGAAYTGPCVHVAGDGHSSEDVLPAQTPPTHYDPVHCTSERVLLGRGWTAPRIAAHLGPADAHKRGEVPAWGADRVLMAEVAHAEVAQGLKPDSTGRFLHETLAKGRAEKPDAPTWGRFTRTDMGWLLVCSRPVTPGDLVMAVTRDNGVQWTPIVKVLRAEATACVTVAGRSTGHVSAQDRAALPLAASAEGPGFGVFVPLFRDGR